MGRTRKESHDRQERGSVCCSEVHHRLDGIAVQAAHPRPISGWPEQARLRRGGRQIRQRDQRVSPVHRRQRRNTALLGFDLTLGPGDRKRWNEAFRIGFVEQDHRPITTPLGSKPSTGVVAASLPRTGKTRITTRSTHRARTRPPRARDGCCASLPLGQMSIHPTPEPDRWSLGDAVLCTTPRG